MPALRFALEFAATLTTAIFAGASLYISLVEHPARMECGTAVAAAEFRPSYRRATIMQASLAICAFLTAASARRRQGPTAIRLSGTRLSGSPRESSFHRRCARRSSANHGVIAGIMPFEFTVDLLWTGVAQALG
jgi:hypothetical protein